MTNTPSIVQTAQPFLLAVCRMPGAIADDELETVIDWGRLDPNSGIEAISLVDEDAVDPASLDLSRYSGVIITGSPFGFGQDENRKSREHQVMERRILALSKRLVEEDVPTLGICFGLQAIVKALGGELVEGDLRQPRERFAGDVGGSHVGNRHQAALRFRGRALSTAAFPPHRTSTVVESLT